MLHSLLIAIECLGKIFLIALGSIGVLVACALVVIGIIALYHAIAPRRAYRIQGIRPKGLQRW